MKRTTLFIIACVLFAACNKTEPNDVTPVGLSFEAGQKVTFSVSAATADTKVLSTNSVDGIDFVWQADDRVLVTVGGESAEFILLSGEGTATAEFYGEMPAAGSTFDVQYPVVTPEIQTTQIHSTTEAFEHDKMLFNAKDCVLSGSQTDIELIPAYAVLRFQLYGKNIMLSKLTVKSNEDPASTYTLNINPTIYLSGEPENASIFNIIVPGEKEFVFTMTADAQYNPEKLRDYIEGSTNFGKGTPFVTKQFKTSVVNGFVSGYVTVMPVKELPTVIWAPANCGTSSSDKYGKYYQFGRYVGFRYVTDATTTYKQAGDYWTSDSCNKSPNASYFYYTGYAGDKGTDLNDWYTNTKNKKLTAWPESSTDAGYVSGKIESPCPTGWKLPVKSDYEGLLSKNTTPTIVTNGKHGGNTGIYGCYFNYTQSASASSNPVVFIPAAGYLTWEGQDMENYARTQSIDYWSSTCSSGSGAYALNYIRATKPTSRKDNSVDGRVASMDKAYGFTVRCIQDGHED